MKLMKEKKFYFWAISIIFLFYIVLTLSHPFFYKFSHDEIHAWVIAQNFGFIDIIRLMRSEGHTFLWYMILKPLTYFYSMYSMKVLNWLFAFSSMLVMWRYAPFPILIKTTITFTTPFLCVYPLLARCYSIGILLLFLIATLYKNRLKRPVLFSLLIFFAANTSLMAAIPALTLGAIFAYDVIKTNSGKIPLFVLFLTVASLVIQWHNPIMPLYSSNIQFLEIAETFCLKRYNFNFAANLALVIYPFIVISAFLFLKNKPRTLIFLLCSWLELLFIFMFVYNGYDYHYYFFYIYLILAYWMGADSNSHKKFFVIMFVLLSLLYCSKQEKKEWNEWIYKPNSSDVAACIYETVGSDSNLYASLFYHDMLIPYLNGINLKDYRGNDLVSFNNFRNIYREHPKLNFDKLYKNAPENSYLLVQLRILNVLNLDYSDKKRYKQCYGEIIYRIK